MFEGICGLQLFQMDVSHQNLSYLTGDCTIQWTEPMQEGLQLGFGWCVITAQGGAFALCRLSMGIKQRAPVFELSHPKSIPCVPGVGWIL